MVLRAIGDFHDWTGFFVLGLRARPVQTGTRSRTSSNIRVSNQRPDKFSFSSSRSLHLHVQLRIDALLLQLGELLLAQPADIKLRALPLGQLLVTMLRRRLSVVAARIFPAGYPAEAGLRLRGVDGRKAVGAFFDLLLDGCAFDDAGRSFYLEIVVGRLEILSLLWLLFPLSLFLFLLLALPLLDNDVRWRYVAGQFGD